MAVTTPTINKIYKMTEFDLARTSYTPGNMYICLDSYKLYYDESVNTRVIYDYVSVSTVNDLRHNITPDYGKTYYCWEDNSLWLWINKWVTLWSDSTYPSAYVYDDWGGGNLTSIYRHDQPLLSADDNGLLHDGSVVVRDRNRIIKGRIYVDDGNDNFVISSFLGGGLRFLPNGQMTSNGEFLIDERTTTIDGSEETVTIPAATLRAEFRTKNYEMFVDYTEEPEMDTNPYATDDHIYQVYHTGNLDAAALHVLTPQEVYQKLRDDSLPATLDLSVARLNGLDASNYSLITHTHTHEAITDFNDAAKDQASIEIGTIFNGATTRGMNLNYNISNKKLSIIAKPYSINLTGDGISGSGTVSSDRNNVDIIVQVNPDGHVHQNYVDRMDGLQRAIDNINVMDPDDYYTKIETNDAIQAVAGTTTPTSGKPLLVNSNGILPGTTQDANQLTTARTLTFTGAVLGQLTTDFSTDETITLDSSPILSTTPTVGKALAVTLSDDSELILDGLAREAKQLDHTVDIDLLGDITGSTNWNTLDNQIEITTTLSETSAAYDKLLLKSHIGTLVPGLDSTTLLIPDTYIADKYRDKLTFKDYYAPRQDPTTQEWLPPTDSALQGDFYILTADGKIGNVNYVTGDWTIYLDGGWVRLSTSSDVWSVNGKNGVVVLDYNDVGAIDVELINYTIQPRYSPTDPEELIGYDEIPGGYVVKTVEQGVIRGASVERLENEITIETDENLESPTDIAIMSNSSSLGATGAIGHTKLGLNMKITEDGYNSILNTVGHEIQNNGNLIEHRRYLNFDSNFIVEVMKYPIYNEQGEIIGYEESDSQVGISLASNNALNTLYFWYQDSEHNNGDEICATLTDMFHKRADSPIVIVFNYKFEKYFVYTIDENTPEPSATSNKLILNNHLYRLSNTSTLTDIFDDNYQLNFDEVTDSEDGSKYFENATLDIISTNKGQYLSTTNYSGGSATTFLPSEDWQPATKAYVDNHNPGGHESVTRKIGGQSAGYTYTVNHNLDTEDVMVQCRYTNTKEQVIMANTIIDRNNITVTSDIALSNEEITVYIYSMV